MKVKRLIGGVAVLFCCGISVAADAPASPEKKPNILFIAVDDLRCDLGCYGDELVISPHIDKLAKSGVLFSRAYCQQAVCNPSRASVMTGLRPDTVKVWDLSTDFRKPSPDVVTIPQHFRKNGYRAVSFGKIFHNSFPDHVSWDEPNTFPDAQCWSKETEQKHKEFQAAMRAAGKPEPAVRRIRATATEAVDMEDKDQVDGAIAELTIKSMRELASGDQPFFLACGFVRPHLPFVSPRKYWDLYDPKIIPLAANGYLPKGAPPMAFGDHGGGFYELRDYMDYSDAPWPKQGPLAEVQQRKLKHGYYAAVSHVDVQIGLLLEELDRLRLAENTIVVLWSDHGWKLGEHGGWCKQTNYEIDARVPLIIRDPSTKGNGKPSNALVELVDIFPTLCDLTAVPIPKELEGKSLRPLLDQPTAPFKDAAFSQFPHISNGIEYMGYAMRTDRYRYIEWLDRKSGELAATELYDHQNDPNENQNISLDASNKELLEKLNQQLWKAIPKPR